MTTAPATDLATLLARTRHLLLDFDGPICAIFAGRPARTVALELLDLATPQGTPIPETVALARDPFDVLRYAATVSPDLTRRVEHTLRSTEIEATRTARPTPHATEVIQGWRATGRTVAIVSNNSSAAVNTYLAAHAIEVDLALGRTSPDPHLLKPNPHLIIKALNALNADNDASVLVGDSISDITAARRAGISSIGYANKPGKRETLSDAGADAILEDMQTLAHAASIACI